MLNASPGRDEWKNEEKKNKNRTRVRQLRQGYERIKSKKRNKKKTIAPSNKQKLLQFTSRNREPRPNEFYRSN